MKSFLTYTTIVTVTIVVGIVGLEIYLRLTGYFHFVNLLRPDYELSYTHKYYLDSQIFGTTIRTNNLGIRHNTDLPSPQENQKFTILCLGDSQTFGFGVEAHETWPAYLESLLNLKYPDHAFEVINAGLTSYDTYQEYILLLKLTEILEIDFVIVGFWHNDIGTSTHLDYRDVPGFMLLKWMYYESRLLAVLRSILQGRLAGAEQSDVNGQQTLNSGYSSVHGQDFSIETNPDFQRIINAFNGFQAWSDTHDVPVYVVYIPHYLHGEDQAVDEQLYERISNVVTESGLYFIDGRGAYRDYSGDPVRLSLLKEYDDDHTSALGNRMIGEYVLTQISDALEQKIQRANSK